MSPREITELKEAIRQTHGCESLYIESVPVKEDFEGKPAWDGIIEVFDLVGHPEAQRCYAWKYQEGDQKRIITVLGVSPVGSPEAAVQVAIAKARSNQH